eukprot:gene7477-6998_t
MNVAPEPYPYAFPNGMNRAQGLSGGPHVTQKPASTKTLGRAAIVSHVIAAVLGWSMCSVFQSSSTSYSAAPAGAARSRPLLPLPLPLLLWRKLTHPRVSCLCFIIQLRAQAHLSDPLFTLIDRASIPLQCVRTTVFADRPTNTDPVDASYN